jgi:ribosomal protein S17E
MAVTQSNHFVAGYITRFIRALKVVEESDTSKFQRM